MARSDKTPATSPDLVPLDVIRSDLRYEATLAPPTFDMLLGGKSFGPVYNALEPLGLRLDDMRVEGQQPAEQALSCYLSARTLVRYRFDRVEVQGRPSEVGVEALFRLIEVAVGVVRSTSHTKIEEHTFTSGLHGRLGVGSVEDQLARHVPAKRADKVALAPSGVTFRVASESAAGFASLERSLLAEDAAFLRVVSILPGALNEPAACEQALAFFRAAAEALGLRVREEQADAGR
ncbi:MAG: hypothetical protein M3495_00495 [Pseudomonadota bacterium]|nr:hypothetical protein [Gammaproteobacteria bacterium]MDQ3580188.1 hypothetical protein [Pseudomonadota bacterium]